MKTIYLDMDGVVADFDEFALRVIGLPPSGGYYPEDQWAKLAAESRLYKDLKKTPYADALVHECRRIARVNEYQLMFLTAVPKGNDMPWAFFDKITWARTHYHGIPVMFGPYSVDKHVHCKPGDVLIDDRVSNIEDWRAAGGIAIHHVSYETTLAALGELG
jgi:hypothetical protein